jgi:phosphoglycolate phosphatase
MNVFDLVVFDLDGTLINSAPDLHVALNSALTGDGRRPLTLMEVESIVGDGATVLVRRALALVGGTVSEDDGMAALTTRFLAIYEQQAAELTRPYAGVPETLATLAAAGFGLGVCTNKPERLSRQILQQLDLNRYFQAVIGGDSLNGIRKPDPRHLLAAVEALGGKPEKTVMVGDSVNDVAAARALGVPVVVRAGGYGQVPAESLGADAVVQAFAELPEAIARLA